MWKRIILAFLIANIAAYGLSCKSNPTGKSEKELEEEVKREFNKEVELMEKRLSEALSNLKTSTPKKEIKASNSSNTTVSATSADFSGVYRNKFGKVEIKNQTQSFSFNISVKSGSSTGEISGKAKWTGQNTAEYSEYIPDFKENCKLLFTFFDGKVVIKEKGACHYYRGVGTTFDGTYTR
ncbi:MAG: hypothetical protein D6687_09030 [Acidobacteria bacterium]|jgi:flagellar capping protein FliD|nr:MAG: hypothetical protein D6687_09030 [Acidobacteriota bacterium]GIU82280.1 MAG: hypothetical protein KatS3mg006_1344 [Pyrinomonadaceae bacterium]